MKKKQYIYIYIYISHVVKIRGVKEVDVCG